MPHCPHHSIPTKLAAPRRVPKHLPSHSHTPLSPQVTGLSVTSCPSQLVVFHTRRQEDLAVCLHKTRPAGDNRVGELVGVLLEHCRT